MFYNRLKEHAISDYTVAQENLQITYDKVQNKINQLNISRQYSVDILNDIKDIINTITNTPREIDTHIKELAINITSFKPVESLSKMASKEIIDAAEELIAGTASALFNTGAGAGWRYVIFALRVGLSIGKVCDGNKKIAKEANELTKKVISENNRLRMNLKGIEALSKEIKCIAELLSIQISKLKEYRCSDYSNLNKEDRTFLGEIVNNALSLSYLLNKKFENEECVNV